MAVPDRPPRSPLPIPGRSPEFSAAPGLLRLVSDAIATVSWERKSECFTIRAGEQFSTETLLALLAYCYALGIYSSQEVQALAIEDRAVNQLCRGQPPDWKTIRRFRRVYRQALRATLAHVLEHALRIRFGAEEDEPPLVDHCVALALDRWFDPLCVPFPEEEAEERLERAVAADDGL